LSETECCLIISDDLVFCRLLKNIHVISTGSAIRVILHQQWRGWPLSSSVLFEYLIEYLSIAMLCSSK